MTDFSEQAISAMHRKGLALDANLFVVLIVGLTERAKVGIHRRTSGYYPDDFDLIFKMCKTASTLQTTPHVLAEVSNLLDTGKKPFFDKEVIRFMELCDTTQETWGEARKLCRMPEFQYLGLADAALCKLAEAGFAVATADWKLANSLQKRNLPAINFHHIRPHLG